MISEIDSNYKIEVYPNPTSDKVKIACVGANFMDDQELKIDLVTTEGEIISFNNYGEHEVEIDLSPLPNGAYILRIRTNQAIETVRILKTK